MKSTRHRATGEPGGQLPACPDRPNCVSSQSSDPRHRIAPLQFSGPADAAFERLRRVLAAQPRLRIVTDRDGYLHAEARSWLFRFVDDLEFLLEGEAGVIHVRSASRCGRSDLGVNRRRVETIRAAFTAASGESA